MLHAEYPLGEAFHIANVAQSGDDSPKVVVASRVDPAGEKDAYKFTFSELGLASCLFRSNLISD